MIYFYGDRKVYEITRLALMAADEYLGYFLNIFEINDCTTTISVFCVVYCLCIVLSCWASPLRDLYVDQVMLNYGYCWLNKIG